MDKECFHAINSLQKNDIIITKPDEGSGVVFLNKSDCVDKIDNIPYLFVNKSENFVPNYCPKSWGRLIHEVALKV